MPLDLFVGRTNELQRYQQFLSREKPWILLIRGLGGSGKSTLLSECEKQTPQGTCVVRLDFAQQSLREDYLTFLENISQQIEPYCDAQRTVEFQQSIARGRYEIGKRVAGEKTFLDLDQEINVTNGELHGASLSANIGETGIQETRRQMREMARAALYNQIRTFRMKHLVIMLDTCEWLNEETAETEAARWAGTELIKGLRSCLQGQGKPCSVVMTSRVPLQIEGLNETDIAQIRLKLLTKAEVNQYLEGMEVHEALIQDYIYNMTYGHPHSLALINDIWEEQWDRPLAVGDFDLLKDLFYERALQDVVDKDVIKRLLKSPLDDLTHYGILLRRFNLPLLQAVFEEWLPTPEARKRFDQLIQYPHVEPVGNFTYVFHQLLREILAGYIRVQEPEKWKSYHQLALNFLEQASVHSPEWYYHLLACDEDRGISYWNEAKTHEPDEYLESLREAARDNTLHLTLAAMQCMDIQRDTGGIRA